MKNMEGISLIAHKDFVLLGALLPLFADDWPSVATARLRPK